MSSQDAQIIASLLLQTFNEQDNEIRKTAENQLKQMSSQNLAAYLNTCIEIIQTQHPQLDEQATNHLKNSAALNLRNTIRSSTKELGALQIQDRLSLLEIIFRTIIQPLEQHVRTSLGFALNPILSIEQGQQDAFAKLLPLISQSLSSDGNSVKGGLRTFRAVFNNMNNSNQIQQHFQSFTPQMIDVATKGVTQLIQSISDPQAEKVAEEALEILQEWAHTIATVLENFDLQCSKNIKHFAEIQEMALIFSNIISITKVSSQEAQQTQIPPSLIATDCSMIAIALDELKSSIMNSFNIVIGHLFETKRQHLKEQEQFNKISSVIGIPAPPNPFIDVALTILPSVINSLIQLANDPDFDEHLDGEFISDLAGEFLQLLYKCCHEPQFFGFFSQYKTQIIIDICFMFLKINDNERDTFNDSPDEFVALGQDTCERQESETPKTVAAQLLESICDHIDGSLTMVVQLICKCLDLSLSQQGVTPQNILNYPDLQVIANSKFLTHNVDEVITETCLMALCVIHFIISKREDLCEMIEKTLINNFQRLFSLNSGIIRCRLNLFFYFYAEHLFHLNEDYFQAFLTFVINSLAPENFRAVMIQASETLSFIVQEEDVMVRVDAQMGKIFPSLINVVSSASEKAFFDAMMEICQSCTELVNEYLVPLLSSLVTRIQAELAKVKLNKQQNQNAHLRKDQLIIVKCWNIIRTICDNKEIIPMRTSEVEQILYALFLYIKEPQEIEFEDDILLCLNSFMKKNESITNVGWELFQYLTKVQDKYRGGFSHMFVTLNCYIIYGKQFLGQNPQYVQLLVEICKNNLFSTPKPNRLNEASNSEGCLLFQVMLQSLPGTLDNELQKIIEAVVLRYLQGQIYCKFFRARLLNVFYSSILYNAQLTMNILSSATMTQTQPPMTYLKYLLTETIANVNCFQTSYDKKLVILGAGTILMEQDIPQDVSELIPALFDLMITILSAPDNSLKTNEDKKADLDMSMSSDESEDAALQAMQELERHMMEHELQELFSNEKKQNKNGDPPSEQTLLRDLTSEETEAQLSMNQLQSQLRSADEFQYFQDIIRKLQETALEGLKALVGSLSEEKQEALKVILQSRRVQITRHVGENTVVRKIVKAKRKNKAQK